MSGLRKIFPIAVSCALAAAVLCAPARRAHAAPQREKIVFALNLPSSLLGRGSVTIWDNFLKLQSILNKKENIELAIVRMNDWREVAASLEAGRADVAWLPPYYYARARAVNPKSAIRPLAAYQSAGGKTSKICVYTMPDLIQKGAYHRLDHLFGARLAFPDEAAWVALNLIFSDARYEFEPYYIFDSLSILNKESSAFALLFGAVDAIIVDELSMKYIVENDPRIRNLVPLACTKPLPNTLIAYRRGMNSQLVSRIKKILTGMHENPDYAAFKDFFAPTSGRWISAENVDYSPWTRVYKKASASGWDKTFQTLPLEK